MREAEFFKGVLAKRGITQKSLAEKIGVSKVHLCNVLNGKSDVSIELLAKIANELGYRVEIKITC